MRTWLTSMGVLIALLVGGCTASPSELPPDPGTRPTQHAVSLAGDTSPTAPATADTVSASQATSQATDTPVATGEPSDQATLTSPSQPLEGKVIVVDPGHNGKYRKSFNTKKVPAGNGKKKACNSSGTAGKGLSEHAYNWAQAKLLKDELEKLGAKVLLTRNNDSGLGPCVNKRAKVANDAKADLLISIHADGSYSKKARGFHIIISTTMAGGSKLEKKSKALALNARAALDKRTKMPRSTYIGKGTALSPRKDIVTLNLLKQTPGIMLEAGNMRHSKDLALMKSSAFRKQVAKALAQAAVESLDG